VPRLLVPALALALTAALTGCSGDDAGPVARPAPTVTYSAEDVPVIVPGAPGEEPTVLQPGQSGTMANAGAFGDADVTFMTDMVTHHKQALEMAELAPQRARDRRVVKLAERIAAGQGPEIDAMQTWLEQQGLPPASQQAHGHAMPGMVTPEDMTRLVAAEGKAFDRLFLQLMSRHHEGALRMAEDAVGARHPVVSELVDDVVATQSVEIKRMQEVLADLPA
jgi:uncharacterized protein (DUF305 family)